MAYHKLVTCYLTNGLALSVLAMLSCYPISTECYTSQLWFKKGNDKPCEK